MRFQRSSHVLNVSHFFFCCIVYVVIPLGLTKNEKQNAPVNRVIVFRDANIRRIVFRL